MSRILTNSKALIFIIAILLITNIGMLLFFLNTCPSERGDRKKGRGPVREKITVFLKKEIGFNDAQLKQFDSLRDEHWKEMKPLVKSMNATKDSFYAHINDTPLDSLLYNSLSDSIAIKQKVLDAKMFNHFRDIRLLCTPDQIPLYDSQVQEVIKEIVNPYRKKGNKK